MNMKLTIVLTVYNKEPYLHRALDALLKQVDVHNGDYEVLAVNDGSTDGSAAILEEYAKRDARVRILKQTNQGLSMARNNGTDKALGEYVWYVDADDTFSPMAVRQLCDAIGDKPDVIPIYAETKGVEKVRNKVPASAETGRDLLLSRKWEQCGVFWVLRRSFLQENHLRFLPGIYHEDAEFTPRMLFYANKVKVVPKVLYTVIHEPNSITGVPRPKRAYDCITVAKNLDEFVDLKGIRNTDLGRLFSDSAAMMINNGISIICQNSKEEHKSFNRYCHNNRDFINYVLQSASQKKYKIESVFFRLFPAKYVQIYKLIKLM